MSKGLTSEARDPLSKFNRERDDILLRVKERVLSRLYEAAGRGEEHSLEYVLNDVAFSEIRRHEGQKSRAGKKGLARWRDLAMRLGRMAEEAKRDELEGLVEHYARDIVGNFNPNVYRFARGVLPHALSFLLHPVSGLRDGLAALSSNDGAVHVEGPIERIQKLCEQGTVIFAPTHSSNLDSLVVGLGLNRCAIPPVTYGAGKNLFSNPLISYFMYNLGAYRVDRRLRFSLYKDILKEYSTVLIERGFHSLFFPGGTRSRSNVVENKLKLGLLGTGLAAFRNQILDGKSDFKVYVVPITINYLLVLEAETLIGDYLADQGRSRYIIEDDEFSQIGRVVEFLRKLMQHDSAVVLRLGEPLDVFGNATNEAGESLDQNGRVVEPGSYFVGADGTAAADEQRDAVYTQELGEALAKEYRRNTVFLSTALACRAIFDEMAEKTQFRDVYRMFRLPPSAMSLSRENICKRIDGLRETIEENPELGTISRWVGDRSASDVLNDAMDVLGKYHTRPVAFESGGRIRVGYPKLLYYYRNRTDHVPGVPL